jgi:hypothetical protein
MKKVVRNIIILLAVVGFVGINLMLIKNLTEDQAENNKM